MKIRLTLHPLRRLALLAALLLLPLNLAHGKAIQGVVNVNTASMAQLTLLPGIGPAKAKAILEKRQGKPLASVTDLLAVPGLGKKRVEALKPHIVFSGPTTAQVLSKKTSPSPAQATGTSVAR